MANAAEKDASYFGPMATATPTASDHGNNTVRFAVTNANISQALDTATDPSGRNTIPWVGRFVNIKNEDPIYGLNYAFSAGAVALVYGQVSASFAAGNAAAGWYLGPGQQDSVIVPPGATHVNFIGANAASTGPIAFRCSEGAVPNV